MEHEKRTVQLKDSDDDEKMTAGVLSCNGTHVCMRVCVCLGGSIIVCKNKSVTLADVILE